MSIMQDYENKLAALKEEIVSSQNQRPSLLIEFGTKALPALRDNKDFAELAKKIDELDNKIEALIKDEEELLSNRAKYEKEEKEDVLRRTCPQCRAFNPGDAKFCEECGAPVGSLPREYCEECGTVNHAGLKFCGECGAKLPD